MANKYLDYDGLLYFWGKLKAFFVAKESGKGLSTNDYTTAEKNKLAGIASGAQVNVIETVKRNGVALTVTSKAVDVTVPTKTSDLTNDSNFPVDASYVHTDNNFTTTLKNKLNGIASGAQVNVIETVKRNGTALTVTDKAVDVTVPTKTSDLTNDSDFVSDASYVHTDVNFTSALKTKLDGIAEGATVDDHKWANVTLTTGTSSTTTDGVYVPVLSSAVGTSAVLKYATTSGSGHSGALAMYDANGRLTSVTPSASDSSTKVATTAFVSSAIASAIGSITGISFEVVQALPATGETGVIYLVAHSHGTGDAYDEYIWLADSSSFEKIGSTDIDLSGYMLKTDMVAITNSEIDTVVAT